MISSQPRQYAREAPPGRRGDFSYQTNAWRSSMSAEVIDVDHARDGESPCPRPAGRQRRAAISSVKVCRHSRAWRSAWPRRVDCAGDAGVGHGRPLRSGEFGVCRGGVVLVEYGGRSRRCPCRRRARITFLRSLVDGLLRYHERRANFALAHRGGCIRHVGGLIRRAVIFEFDRVLISAVAAPA